MIYLDYASATPVDKEVLDVFINANNDYFANPNSMHIMGKLAKSKLDSASNSIAERLRVKENELIYTSGATETNNLVIKGIARRYKNFGKHILLSSLEHQSLVAPATSLEKEGFACRRNQHTGIPSAIQSCSFFHHLCIAYRIIITAFSAA